MNIKNFVIASAALLFVGGANAGEFVCVDDGSAILDGKIRSSSITTDGATLDISECGPWVGNDPKDFPATLYGDGWNGGQNPDPDGWVELDKADGGNGTLITGTGWGTTSGTFSLNNDQYHDYLIVLKFDGVFSAFLSDTGVFTDWGWNTDVDGDNKFAISHLAVYVRGDTVPAPGPLVVMAIGLVGMLGLRRVKKVI